MNETTCDLCALPLTGRDYDDRITPHETYCPNYWAHETDAELVDCDCDRNYHHACWLLVEDDDEAEAMAEEAMRQ